MPTYWGFHSLLLYQGHMVPDSTEEGTLGLANIEHLAFAYHDVDNTNGLACDRKIWFEKATIGKHNSSCGIDKSTKLTLVTAPTTFS